MQPGETGKGIVAMAGAGTIWGLSPLFYKLLSDLPAMDVLAHRTVWSLFFFVGILWWQGRSSTLITALQTPAKAGWIAIATAMIAVNWFLFIYGIQIGRVTETSLGYYIFPLVSVLFGAVLFGERLGRAQILAVVMAGAAVLLLTWSLGAAPWISLILAFTFAIYGAIKKRVSDPPMATVTAEILLLAPIAVFWLFVFGAGMPTVWQLALLVISGPLTAFPLMLFSYGSKRITMATAGLMTYINPTLQFLCAVIIFSEPWSTAHAAAFAMIWVGLIIYSLAAFRDDRKASIAPSTVSTD